MGIPSTVPAPGTNQVARNRAGAALFFAVFLAHGYFYNSTGWNQNARLDTVYALVEGGLDGRATFAIDRFISDARAGVNTGDWARSGGHYYSNKAPGSSIVALPVYFALYHAERTVGMDPLAYGTGVFNAYIVNLWTSPLWSALGCLFLFRLLTRRMGWSPLDALTAALVYGLATLLWPFSTQLWGHPTAASMLVMGTHALSMQTRRTALAAGFLFAASVATEYLTAISLALAFGYVAAVRPRLLPNLVTGAISPLAALGWFHKVHFGSWITTAAAVSNPVLDGDKFTSLSPAVLSSLLTSPGRGLLLFSPVLLLSVLGMARAFREKDRLLWFVAVNAVGYLMAVACYAGWHGGRATGPRYLVVALAFWCLLLPAWSDLSRLWKVIAGALAGISALNALAIAAVDPMVYLGERNPLYGWVWPQFLRGELATREAYPFHVHTHLTAEQGRDGAFNLGQAVLGLEGLASLLPLLMVLVVLVFLAYRAVLAVSARRDRTGQ